MQKLAYVLDTDVIVAALRSSQRASRQPFLSALGEGFELLVSVPLFLEHEAGLIRPQHLSAAGLHRSEVERVLNDIAAVATPTFVDGGMASQSAP
jgi:hypothetical protein